jgi:hypothetical protein
LASDQDLILKKRILLAIYDDPILCHKAITEGNRLPIVDIYI